MVQMEGKWGNFEGIVERTPGYKLKLENEK